MTQGSRSMAAAALQNIVGSNSDPKRGRREAKVLSLLTQVRGYCDQLREVVARGEGEGRGIGGGGETGLFDDLCNLV